MFEATANARLHGLAKDYVRTLIARAVAAEPSHARDYVASRWAAAPNMALVKAAVAEGRTDGATWGDALTPLQQLASAFVSVVRARTVLGRLDGAQQVPFNIQFPRQVGRSSFAWVREGGARPASALSFEADSFRPLKIGGLVVSTVELAKFSDPSAEDVIFRDLADGLVEFMDAALLATTAGVTGTSPAGILYGAPSLNASGTSAAAAAQDLRDLLALVANELENPFWVMRRSTAVHLAAADQNGGPFRDLGVNGGIVFGIPVLTTAAVPQGSDSPPHNRIALLDASQVMYGDGSLEMEVSTEGSVQMVDTPDSPATSSTVAVSLWQHNLVAFAATRYVNWKMRRSGSAAYLDKVEY